MSKIIIQNNTDRSDANALIYVGQVIKSGRISDNGKQYCYHTEFKDGIHVSAFLNKRSDRFVIHYNSSGAPDNKNPFYDGDKAKGQSS